jgi:single-stranded DNA-binding protein
MVDGRLSSRQGQAKDGQKRIYTKVMIERLYYGPKTSSAATSNGTGETYAAAGGQYHKAEPAQTITPNAQPVVPTPEELPF